MPDDDISAAARALGAKGGGSKSERKAAAARENGKKGGDPRKFSKALCPMCAGVTASGTHGGDCVACGRFIPALLP